MSGTTTFSDRIRQLQGLQDRLEKHHFGLGKEIHRLQNAVAPWYLFPGTQTRPRTIGLWGMTGTGKTSLVRSTVRELDLEDVTFWLDAGECRSNCWMDQLSDRLAEHLNGKPFVVVVDEFQHARTKGPLAEAEPTELRRFWEMLDAGRMITWPNYFELNALADLHDRLETALKAGVRIARGVVVEGVERFKQLVTSHYSDQERSRRPQAIPKSELEMLRRSFTEPRPSMPALEDLLAKADGAALMLLLRRLRTNAQRPDVVDARQALVILLGNLDELYVMGQEPLADLDRDVLMERHEDIGNAGMQHALSRLFRIEQVARMGTDHLIFPPISTGTVDRMIGHELDRIIDALQVSSGHRLRVDPLIVAEITSMRTAAIMGARPVIEAVQRIIPSLFAQALSIANDAAEVLLTMNSAAPIALIKSERKERILDLQWPMDPDRRPTSDEEIRRHAIHEAGHAICGFLLCGLRPLQICARTTDPNVRGFVVWERSDNAVTRDLIIPNLARMLGGHAAEQNFLGAEKVSSGSSQDLRSATLFALTMSKQHGLGGDRIFHAEHPACAEGGYRTGLEKAELQAKEWIEAAEELALDTIRSNTTSIDRLVKELIRNGSLGMKELEQIMPFDRERRSSDGVIEAIVDVKEKEGE